MLHVKDRFRPGGARGGPGARGGSQGVPGGPTGAQKSPGGPIFLYLRTQIRTYSRADVVQYPVPLQSPENKMICISCLETATLQLMQYCVLVRCSLALSSSLPTSPRQENKTSGISCFFTHQGGARRRKPTRLLWGNPSLCNTASWFLPRLLCCHRHQHHRYGKTKRAAIGTHITEARKQNEQHLLLFHGSGWSPP